jgi:iron-sulfur cluster assembly protein
MSDVAAAPPPSPSAAPGAAGPPAADGTFVPIYISPKAAGELKRIMAEAKLPPETGIRVSIKGGGCSGFTYDIGFEHAKRGFDQVMESEGIRLFVDTKSYLFTRGMTLDFNDDLLNRGFKFVNPNAKSSCGCGTSFSI